MSNELEYFQEIIKVNEEAEVWKHYFKLGTTITVKNSIRIISQKLYYICERG